MVEALKILCNKIPNLVIKPLPMCTNHFGSDDRWFYRRLFRGQAELKNRLDDSLLGPELPPAKYWSAFKNADALLGMRFHSLVFGIGIGTNAVALDYTLGKGKVRSLAERFDLDYMCMSKMEAELLASKMESAISSAAPSGLSLSDLSFTNSLNSKLSEVSA
ncbi:MAG: hypothetical protein CMG93_06015 [Marinomonas sp.]|nr:hypothetical protein [Marinomonas sp.]